MGEKGRGGGREIQVVPRRHLHLTMVLVHVMLVHVVIFYVCSTHERMNAYTINQSTGYNMW